jgi:hypothetical protein
MSAIDLYWLPLGAGGRFVRTNGRLYEAVAARVQRRDPSVGAPWLVASGCSGTWV